MSNLSTTQLLLIVNAYIFLILSVLALSVSDLVCRVRQGSQCARQRLVSKFIIAMPLMLSCLALLVFGLFVMGLSHGSGPEDYEILLFVVGCLAPFFLLIFWFVGRLWVDALWVATITALFVYLLFVNPALVVRVWADDNHQWAQIWIARHYETGQGGLKQSDSMARVWYKKAAVNGNSEAQYQIAQTKRRSKSARKWYLLAAEQGHTDAMVQLARLTSNSDERLLWLNRAADQNHPEAIYMLAQNAMKTDLPSARQLLLEAAEEGSRSAIIFLITEYQQGGVLYAQNEALARQWQSVLENTPASDIDPGQLTTVKVNQKLQQAKHIGSEINSNEALTLYQRAKAFLGHPAKDQLLHDRAIEYLIRAANNGHSEAAIELAKLAIKKSLSHKPNEEALEWLELAASANNRYALKQLSKYYKEKPDVNIDDLVLSLDYNERLLMALQTESNSRQGFQQQHWSEEYRHTQKMLTQLQRLGGSWQTAMDQAKDSPKKEYLLAKELVDSGKYRLGMQHMKSAAQRGNREARFKLARQTLRGPRSFTQEIEAISVLQALDQLDFLPASYQLGLYYQSETGVVPKNLYLARQLFRKAQADIDLSEKALRMLKKTPSFTDSLLLSQGDNLRQKITTWYEIAGSEVEDLLLLQQQYKTLLVHFSDIEQLKRQAADNDAEVQYQLAQVLQSHNLAEAMHWLRRAASNGNNNAQYELVVRMLRGKKNPPETQQDLRNWAITASDEGHIGAMIFLATQFKNGNGGFEKNAARAKKYYQQALQSTDADILFEGKIAGRAIDIKRSSIENSVATLSH